MPGRLGRPLPVGLQVLSTLFVPACAGSGGNPDGGADAPAIPLPEVVSEAPALADRDARAGLPGGAACDAAAQCLSGACTLGFCSDWAHAGRVTVDTTLDGANVKQTVTDFPLLLRLDAANFAFAEARRDGADIRFVNAAGHGLAHEIERWDADGKLANLWVLVPRIEGDTPDNAVFMYWGNPLAAPADSGPSVFGGFACVLHMGESDDGIATHLADSSGHGNTGLLQSAPDDPTPTEGMAGPALLLDGDGAYLATTIRSMSPQTFTVSLWLRTTSAIRGGLAGFASKQSAGDARFDRAVWMDENGRLAFGILRGSSFSAVASVTGYNDGAWHQVVARFSDNGHYLFVDGESVADDPTVSSAESFYGYWRFGQEPLAAPSAPSDADAAILDGNCFAGALDEIRINTDETSEAWIKLAYATQRPGANAVVFSRQP
ncbi:MAG: DUF2341 domain-containing protein [Deltaproteobacteria bacterium]|nr:DUF2341 domain-containing protein [Deltaproteobacteria bacterium]